MIGQIVLILVVASLNLVLGYVIAVRLGYGPRSLHETWDVVSGNGDRMGADLAVNAILGQMVTDSAAPPPTPPATLPTESFQDSVLAFRKELRENEASLIRIDEQLRSAEPPTAETIEAQTRALREACEAYLAVLRKTAERYRGQLSALGPVKSLGEQIDMALVEQSTLVDATVRNLGQLDLASDLVAALQRLSAEIATLLGTIHQLRDYLDTACVTLARPENRLNSIDNTDGTDPMTNLPNRLGLEQILQQWWQENRHQTQPHCAALFDLDDFAKINQDHGVSAGNQVLRGVAERMREGLGPDDLIVRYSGQRIAVLLSGVEAEAALQSAERLAQTVHASGIPYGEMAIPVNLTGAVVSILPHDAPQDVLERLERTLVEAKRTARGKVVLQNGEEGKDEGLRTKD